MASGTARPFRLLVVSARSMTSCRAASMSRLACADDEAQGQALDVFWDYELDRWILEEESWEDLATKGFDPPRQFAAFLHTLRWNCITARDPNLFQAPFRAGIKIHAYPMEPLRKALRLPRVNLFIADDTGSARPSRRASSRESCSCGRRPRPSSWRRRRSPRAVEDGARGTLRSRVRDPRLRLLDEIRRERGFGVNPWRTHSRFLVSHNLLIDSTYTDPMKEWLGPLLPGAC